GQRLLTRAALEHVLPVPSVLLPVDVDKGSARRDPTITWSLCLVSGKLLFEHVEGELRIEPGEQSGGGEDVIGVDPDRRVERRQRPRAASPKGTEEDLATVGAVGEDAAGADHLARLAQVGAVGGEGRRAVATRGQEHPAAVPPEGVGGAADGEEAVEARLHRGRGDPLRVEPALGDRLVEGGGAVQSGGAGESLTAVRAHPPGDPAPIGVEGTGGAGPHTEVALDRAERRRRRQQRSLDAGPGDLLGPA